MRNELDGALSTTLGAGKKAAPGLHSIRVEDAVVIHLSRGPLWCPAKPDIHLGDSINVPGPSTQAGKKWLGQRTIDRALRSTAYGRIEQMYTANRGLLR